jgi:hypothetical protein
MEYTRGKATCKPIFASVISILIKQTGKKYTMPDCGMPARTIPPKIGPREVF